MKLLLYCTKAKPYLYNQNYECYKSACYMTDNEKEETITTSPFWTTTNHNMGLNSLNGKIVAECDFEVEEISLYYGTNHAMFDEKGYFDDNYDYMTNSLDEEKLLKDSCLKSIELEKYLGDKNGYVIHIKNLHIFDKPRELSDYCKINKKLAQEGEYETCDIKQTPQNMMYCEDGLETKILISIQPQWLCKILNGEKTIEVRKKVLKEMV